MLRKLFVHEARMMARPLSLLVLINLSAAALLIACEHAVAALDDADSLLALLLTAGLIGGLSLGTIVGAGGRFTVERPAHAPRCALHKGDILPLARGKMGIKAAGQGDVLRPPRTMDAASRDRGNGG